MRTKLFLGGLVILTLGFFGEASASPFAVTDKFTTGAVTSCVFTLNGTAVTNTPISIDATNSVCKLDVVSSVNGSNNITVQYKNIWGTSSSVPFAYTKALPGIPSGIHLEE